MDTGIGEDLRWLFVSFLFATVTSEIASKFSTLFLDWRKRGPGRLPTLAHLILAAVVVMTSWIGWSLDTMHHTYPQVTEVFGFPTVLLVVDFALLTLYYALVKGIDVEKCNVNARDASLWSLSILTTYLIWDFVAVRIHHPVAQFWPRVYVSLECGVFALLAFILLKDISAKHPVPVFFADISLVSLFLLYRALKQYATAVPSERRHFIACAAFFSSFVLSLAVAASMNRFAKIKGTRIKSFAGSSPKPFDE
jgi:hypothetical protein